MVITILETLNRIAWGIPTLCLFLGSGLWFSWKTRWVQIRCLPKAFVAIRSDLMPPKDGADKRNLSTTGALLASLGAVMGPGNLIGVSSAILIGGAGAIFWMWLSAVLGMATRYIESALAVRYRQCADGVNYGGPMYVMRAHGWKRMAAIFSVAGIFLSLTMANALPAGALGRALEVSFSVPTMVTGIFLTVFTAMVIYGGGRRIAKVSAVLIPVVCFFFIGVSLWILAANPTKLWDSLTEIVCGAFSTKAGIGGLVGTTIRFGFARGIYSNEAGMGTEPILAASTAEPNFIRQGFISMTGPFLDTVVFCSFTAFVVVMAGMIPNTDAATLTAAAFASFLPGCGEFVVQVTMTLLVMATLSSWAFYGEQCITYFSKRPLGKQIYRGVYILLPLFCVTMDLQIIFLLSDLVMALMAIPNLLVCLRLGREVYAKKTSETSGCR